jgi:hypothetical protein
MVAGMYLCPPCGFGYYLCCWKPTPLQGLPEPKKESEKAPKQQKMPKNEEPKKEAEKEIEKEIEKVLEEPPEEMEPFLEFLKESEEPEEAMNPEYFEKVKSSSLAKLGSFWGSDDKDPAFKIFEPLFGVGEAGIGGAEAQAREEFKDAFCGMLVQIRKMPGECKEAAEKFQNMSTTEKKKCIEQWMKGVKNRCIEQSNKVGKRVCKAGKDAMKEDAKEKVKEKGLEVGKEGADSIFPGDQSAHPTGGDPITDPSNVGVQIPQEISNHPVVKFCTGLFTFIVENLVP